MQRLITTIWLSLVILSWANAQESEQESGDFKRINTETYRFYMEQKWDSLIDVGKEGLRTDIDYYYLRMRMGVAWFGKKNYRKASRHYTAALKQNQGDPLALESLYYSRLYSGQYEQARVIRKQFRSDLAMKLPTSEGRFFHQVSAEYLYNKGVDDGMFENTAELYPSGIAGVQYTTRHYSNASLSVVNNLAPGVLLTHAYNYLSKSNHYFYNDGLTGVIHPDQRVSQHQYYLSPQFTTQSGYTFKPMVHILGIRYQAAYESSMGFQGGTQWLMGSVKETDIVTGLSFKKNVGPVDLHLGGWYGALNNAEQFQGRAGFTWFPLGNLNLYAGGFFNSQYEIIPDRKKVVRLIPEMMFGFAISGKVWFDLNGVMGDMTNYLENNGMIVYNSFSEVIDKKVRFSVTIPVTQNGSLLYLGGVWTSHYSEFYPLDTGIAVIPTPITYNSFSIYGGISWKF